MSFVVDLDAFILTAEMLVSAAKPDPKSSTYRKSLGIVFQIMPPAPLGNTFDAFHPI